MPNYINKVIGKLIIYKNKYKLIYSFYIITILIVQIRHIYFGSKIFK